MRNSTDSLFDSLPEGLKQIMTHLEAQMRSGTDVYGEVATAVWMSSLDTRTGKYPEDDSRPADHPSRVYRLIGAPKGSNPYWDLPLMVAAKDIAGRSARSFSAESVERYLDFVFENVVDPDTGLILWGNHYFYEAFVDQMLFFRGDTASVYTPAPGNATHHEARPIPVPWNLLWAHDSVKTERYLRAMLDRHLVNPSTGEFDRHSGAGGQRHAFLESGGILVHAAAWLYAQTNDSSLITRADRFIDYSLSAENPDTGLVSNCPNSPVGRWDRTTTTTEIGHWARSVLASIEYVPPETGQRWLSHADRVITAWLDQAWSETDQRYRGMLDINTGAHVTARTTVYQPGAFSDPWEPLFPTHDYAMSTAEACLELYRKTNAERYRIACGRWTAVLADTLPARQGKGAYAEQYGRAIHFLMGCQDLFGDESSHALARRIADEARGFLWAGRMFRSHPGEDRYDSVDGLGFFFLALLWLETGEKPDYAGFYM